ncbi:MAG: sensor histidine kinase [Eggerthellaceae bacterium]
MSFKRRIAISNIIMIAVPAAAALICAGICLLVGWNVLLSGSGADDSSDFQQAGLSVDAAATAVLSASDEGDRAERFNRLDALLDKLGMSLVVVPASSDGSGQSGAAGRSASSASVIYEHDAHSSGDSDATLLAEAEKLGDSAYLQSGQDAVRVSTVDAGGGSWRLYLQGTVRPQASGSGLLAFALISLAAVFLAVVVSAFLANRFVSRFLVAKVQERLGVLETGLEQLNGGNLSYRIDPVGTDEFAPTCREFNRMAEALESSITAVREQDSRRARLVADVLHDLRTPLSSIKGYAEGLRDGVAATPQARERYLDTIIRKAGEMSALLERMVEYSKLELQQSESDPRLLRADALVAAVAEDYGDRLDVSLDVEPTTVFADEQLMRRVVANILDNAVKYGAGIPAPVHIRVGHVPADEEGAAGVRAACRIEIADHGTPVSEQEAASLFDLFYRADKARTSTVKGSGIGLAFAKRAVEGMGGTIAARPNGGAGLVVTIVLPEGERA